MPDDLMIELRQYRGEDSDMVFPQQNNWRRDFLVDCKRAGIGTHWRVTISGIRSRRGSPNRGG